MRCGGAGCSRGLSAGEAAALWAGSFLRERRPGRKHAPGAEGRLSQMTGSLRPSGCQAAGQTAERGVRERARAGPPGGRGARGRRSARARPGFLGTAGRAAERGGRCRGRAPAPRAVLWSACGAEGFFSLWGRGLGDAAGTPAVSGGGRAPSRGCEAVTPAGLWGGRQPDRSSGRQQGWWAHRGLPSSLPPPGCFWAGR